MLFTLLNYISKYYNYYNNNYYFENYSKILDFIPKIREKINEQNINIDNDLIIAVNNFCNNKNIKLKILVSLSGGVDSMVLTTILKFLNYNVICLHINYNNRNETIDEQEFLEKWCNNNNITLYTKSINNIKRNNTKRSDYEYESKKIRFDFYKSIMLKENCDSIMLAHHKDDIVENIFANVCRGRYILDLAVIKEESIINDVKILRPLINFYKTNIYEFANSYQVPYFKDTTPNWSIRGKYRNNIYPILEDTFSGNIKHNLLGLSNQSYEWNELISKEIVDPFINSIIYCDNKCTLNIENYINYPMCFWNIIFMKIFYKYGINCPSRKAINVFINSIKQKKKLYISLSNHCICKYNNNNIIIEFKICK